jgi:large subunit ribosomal protein L17
MPAPAKGRRPGGSPAHLRRMLANLATALFEHCKITTTGARARRLRPVAERLITFAKRGDLHARRQILTMVTDRKWRPHAVRRDRAELRSPRGRLRPGHQGELMVLVMGHRGHGRPCAAHCCAAPSLRAAPACSSRRGACGRPYARSPAACGRRPWRYQRGQTPRRDR